MNKNYNYKKLTPFKWFVLQNFPFIDEDFDAITNYQLFCKLGEEINKLINSTNDLGTQVETLTDYVNNYFDNLDVTEEINNKLDQMAEDGTLAEIIGQYVDPKFEEFTNEISDFENNVNNKLDIQDINIDLINNKVESVASGSPAGVYDTVSDLTSADPDHTKIYLVTSNGNWYYYNTSNNSWTSGGIYISNPNDEEINILDNEIKELQNNKKIGSITNNKIASSSGGQINFTNSNIFSYLEIDLSNIDTNILNKIKATFKMSQYLYFIIYTNGSSVIKQEKLHTSEQEPEQITNYELDIPENCTNIYINGDNTGILSATITTLENTKNAINNVIDNKKYKSIVENYYKGYYSLSGGKPVLNNSINFLCCYANINANDILKLSFFASQYTYYIFLTDENDNIILTDYLNLNNEYHLELEKDYIIPNNKNIKKIFINSSTNYPCDIKKLDYTNNIINNHINCWGDSLTDGSGSTDGNGYISYLQTLLGNNYNVNNYGIAGEKTNLISKRRGTQQLYLNPVNIDSNNEIPITISDYKLDNINDLFMRGGEIIESNFILGKFAINPVQIGNILAMIKQQSNGNYTLQKISGDNINITRPTKIETLGSKIQNNKVDIFWCGTNDLNSLPAEELVDMIKLMIENTKSNNYIVLGITANNPNRSIYNNLLEKNFGIHFIDIYNYMINYGLEDENITPTQQDIEDIENGYIPLSLTNADKLHFNDYGYEVIANQIYKKGIELKYW